MGSAADPWVNHMEYSQPARYHENRKNLNPAPAEIIMGMRIIDIFQDIDKYHINQDLWRKKSGLL